MRDYSGLGWERSREMTVGQGHLVVVGDKLSHHELYLTD
jgi:hypothetical protein